MALVHRTCHHCRELSADIKLCSRCMTGRYCSVECQRAAWGTHKKHCEDPLAALMNQAMRKRDTYEKLEGILWKIPVGAAMCDLPVIAAGATIHIDLGARHHHGSEGSTCRMTMGMSGAWWAYRYRNETLVLSGPMSVDDMLAATSVAVSRECVRNRLIKEALSTAFDPTPKAKKAKKARNSKGLAPLPVISAKEAARAWQRHKCQSKDPKSLPAVLECEGDVLAGVTAAQMAAEVEENLYGGSTRLVAWRTVGARKYRLEWSETF
jgi:hypothetical protein